MCAQDLSDSSLCPIVEILTLELTTAVDRWYKEQVACKIVKLKSPSSDQIVSYDFHSKEDGGPVGVRGVRREVEMLKTLCHVGTKGPIWEDTNFIYSPTSFNSNEYFPLSIHCEFSRWSYIRC